ncbi:hypothetical protein SpCBS45565_g02953 [Spizellomyces sp. 'palustris']|nr:hypothetical protein SpCBS45565_g02953 [Spizellomyces sp. 'palustris']
MRTYTTCFLAIIGFLVAVAAAATVGDSCNPAKDMYACNGKLFLQCNAATGNWTLQNKCKKPCAKQPEYAPYCGSKTQTPLPTSTPGPFEAGASCGSYKTGYTFCDGAITGNGKGNLLQCAAGKWVIQNKCNCKKAQWTGYCAAAPKS